MLTVRWARGLLSVLIVLMLNPFIPTLGACDESPTPASPTGLVEEASIPSLDPSEGTLLGLVDGQIVENLGQKGLGGGELFIEGGPLSVAFFPGQVSYFLRGEGDLDGYHFSMSFEGGRDVVPEGLQPLDHRTNYFLGNDPDRWIRGARSFTGVGYEEVWSSIDVRFSLTDDHLKYDAIVLPGGDPGEVLLRFNSVDALDIDGPTGDLLISTPAGIVRDKAPFAYQDGVDGTVQVPVRYDLVGTDSVGFEVGYYDPSRPLVIDPEMEYSTFIGGSGDDFPGDWDTIVADDMGHVYMSGSTKSSNFPIELGAYDSNINGNLDLFVLKFNETTQTLDYSTYIGGSTDDRCSGIVVNETGCVVLLAGTNGGNFPATTGAYDTSYNGRMDNAIVKLKPDGSDLVFSTFVGGSGNDRAGGIDLDKYGNVYVVGWELQVGGGNFPTTGGSYDPSFNGNNDGFVYKLKSDGSGPLIFSTYIGGSYWEHMTGIHVYDDGSVIFAGYTNSGNFPTKAGAHQRNIQGSGFPLPYEGTVSKLSADGSDLLLSTFFGGTRMDSIYNLEVDSKGYVYIVGTSESTNLPDTAGTLDPTHNGGGDGFIAKMEADLSDVVYSTYIGGSGTDNPRDIMIDAKDDVLVSMRTSTQNLQVTADALQNTHGGGTYDGYLAIVNETGSQLEFATYLGGSGTDEGKSLWVSGGTIWLSSSTGSGNFPTTPNCYDRNHNGNNDVALTKIVFGRPPVWLDMPSLEAVEDVPFVFDFTWNVTDPDSPFGSLTIDSYSPYVMITSGLSVTFLFPNAVVQAVVPLILSDGVHQAVQDVAFTIRPVNDAPDHNIPQDHFAVEDVPYQINATSYVWDIDNATRDLWLEADDPFVEADGLIITATFPQGVLSYEMGLNLTDGLLTVPVALRFSISPVDDPPTISPLGEFTAIEDQDSVFNITPFLSDVDSPIEGLQVLTRSPNCTVDGQEVHFLYIRGGFDESVLIQVTDGRAMVSATLLVHVEERNDAPVVHTVSPRGFIEEEAKIVDLTVYIEDEDTPLSGLTLSCQDPAVVGINGFNLTLRFDEWVPEHEVEFTVSDGFLFAQGSFLVQVQAVNDPPVIVSVGEHVPPVHIEINEGAERWFDVVVEDVDSTTFKYSVESLWDGLAVFSNGSLRIVPRSGEVGTFNVTLIVDDNAKGVASIEITIVVLNVNDRPSRPLITSPNNHTVVEQGENVTFNVDINDPDMVLGQVLTVTWISNISGIIEVRNNIEGLEFTRNDLALGDHRITVRVTDLEFEEEAWFDLSVIEKYVPPDTNGDDEGSFLSGSSGMIVIVVIIILVLLLVANFLIAAKRKEGVVDEPLQFYETSPDIPVVVDEGSAPVASPGETSIEVTNAHGLGLPSLIPSHVSNSKDETSETMSPAPVYPPSPEATTASAAPPSPQPVMEPVAVPPPSATPPPVVAPISEEEAADRAHSAEVRDVMRMLTQLPRGLPTELWNMDMSQLAKDIVDGPKRTAPDGTPLVKIKRRWYSADLVNVGHFLREWQDEETEAPSVPTKDKAEKLEQLESRLLEGKISEETYERLRKKYEGE